MGFITCNLLLIERATYKLLVQVELSSKRDKIMKGCFLTSFQYFECTGVSRVLLFHFLDLRKDGAAHPRKEGCN